MQAIRGDLLEINRKEVAQRPSLEIDYRHPQIALAYCTNLNFDAKESYAIGVFFVILLCHEKTITPFIHTCLCDACIPCFRAGEHKGLRYLYTHFLWCLWFSYGGR